MNRTERLNAAIDSLGINAAILAFWLGVNDRTARRWCSGQNAPPENVVAWVEAIAEMVARKPPGWHDQAAI